MTTENNLLPLSPISTSEINLLYPVLEQLGPAVVYAVLQSRSYLYAGLSGSSATS